MVVVAGTFESSLGGGAANQERGMNDGKVSDILFKIQTLREFYTKIGLENRRNSIDFRFVCVLATNDCWAKYR